MNKDTVNLTIQSIVTGNAGLGYLHVYRELDDSEVEIMVDFFYDYEPYEAQTLEYPGCDENVWITSVVDSRTGEIDYNIDCIDNLSDVEYEIIKLLKERHEDA